MTLPPSDSSFDRLPDSLQHYKSTPVFTEETLPAGLQRQHRTRAGTWGLIKLLSGRLRFQIHTDPPRETILDPDNPGVIPPQVYHEVEPLGPIQMQIDFYR